MSYNPVNWVNGETPINDTNLNNMDNGIADAHSMLEEHESKINEFANQQLPEEYLQEAVDAYVSENEAGLFTKAEAEELNEKIDESVRSLSSEIANHHNEVTQLYDYNALEEGGYYNDNGVFVASNEYHAFTFPCVAGDIFYINHNFTSLTLTCFDSNKNFIRTYILRGNKIEVPNNESIAFISTPIHVSRKYDTVISMEYLTPNTRPLKCGETKNLDAINYTTDFAKVLKSRAEYEDLYSFTEYPNGVVVTSKFDSSLTEGNRKSSWSNFRFNTCNADMIQLGGLTSLAENEDVILGYQISAGTFYHLHKDKSGLTALKTIDNHSSYRYKKVNMSITNNVFKVYDLDTKEVYINEDITDILIPFEQISVGVAISFSQTYVNNLLCRVYDSTAFTTHQPKATITNNTEVSHWKGKVCYIYGTSLTDVASGSGKYVPYLAELSGLNVVNKGIAGGALVANRNIYNRLMDNTDGKVSADLIIIEVGANDNPTPIGDINSMDNTTFCGALNTCLKNVLMNCPKAQVVLMPSTRTRHAIADSTSLIELDRERAGGGTYEERDEAIRKVAVANGIYYIPFGSGLGLGLFRQQSSDLYNVDHIHHTELGGYNLAQGVWSYLKNIPLWYSELPQ